MTQDREDPPAEGGWFEDEQPRPDEAPEPVAQAEPDASAPAVEAEEPAARAAKPAGEAAMFRRRRIAVLAALVVLLLGGGGALLLTGGGDEDEPVQEAGSRFGSGGDEGAGGSLLDALAPVLATRAPSKRGGEEPAPPRPSELVRNPARAAEAVAGLFLVGFRGKRPDDPFMRRLDARPYGGVLITQANFRDTVQMRALNAQIQLTARAAGHPAPLIAISQEGGDLNTLPGSPRAQAVLGDAPRRSVSADAARAGRRLRFLGIGMNLAPNADIAVAGGPAQGRGFSDSVPAVTRSVKAALEGYRQADVVAAVGHFPGQGAAAQDPAVGAAPVGLSLEALREGDMRPFAAVARGRTPARAIQMSNALYVAYDSVTPATLLPDAVGELRKRIGFKGTIVSADLVAATGTTGESVGKAAVEAVKAGVDLLLVPGGRAQQDEAFRAVVSAVRRKEIPAERVTDALKRIAELREVTRSSRRSVVGAAQRGILPGVVLDPAAAP